jgi:peptidoglycan/xylan/chitin deacetylase (PgdA/CDA1 family)
MPELLEIYHTGGTLPPRATLVTFDDAYCDFAEYAWPIMQRYHLPVTLFVPTGFPDRPERIFWWDWLYQAVTTTARRSDLKLLSGIVALATPTDRELAFSHIRDHLKSLPHEEAMRTVETICAELEIPRPAHAVLGWQALRRLAAQGVTLGAHTRNHPLMNRIEPQQMQAEALGSLHDLEKEIGSALPIFAYPSGGMNEQAVQVLAEAGFVLAFGTQRGINTLYKTHPLCLRRINVGPRTTLPILRAQLLSWSNYLN